MTIVILIYILLLIVFLAISSLVLRHAVKFGYLSPSFKIVIIIFGVMALCVIIFSIYLMFQVNKPYSGYEYYDTGTESTSNDGLNF
jgi:hypothetical protein